MKLEIHVYAISYLVTIKSPNSMYFLLKNSVTNEYKTVLFCFMILRKKNFKNNSDTL